MRRYETIFILRPDLGESTQKDTIRRLVGIVGASSGEIIETDEWGFRELAYNIRGERRGFYVRLDYGGNGATMNEVERNLKLSDSVLRYLSVLVDRDVDPASVRAELDAHQRRTAEARAAAEAARAAAEAARAAATAEATSGGPHVSEEVAEEATAETPLQEGSSTEAEAPESKVPDGEGDEQG